MQRREFMISAATLAGSAGGCGWLLHPERCGQPHCNQIDWKIAALDGLGLLLFFVPGVVAFVVDFYTGAIYLPAMPCPPAYPQEFPTLPPPSPQQYPAQPAPPPQQYPVQPALPPQASHLPRSTTGEAYVTDLNRIDVPRSEISPQRIEQIVSRHVGQPVSLATDDVRLSHLRGLDHYAAQCQQHERNRDFGFHVRRLLKGVEA